MRWGSQGLLALPWVLVPGGWYSVTSFTSTHWYSLQGLFSSAVTVGYKLLAAHASVLLLQRRCPVTSGVGEIACVWWAQLTKEENISQRGHSPVVALGIPWSDSASLRILCWGLSSNQVNLLVDQWWIAVNLKSWRFMEMCPLEAYSF